MSQSLQNSYPPSLRLPNPPTHHHQSVDSNLAKHSLDFSSVDPLPIIDLQSIDKKSQSETEKLIEACKDWGIFRLVNHGIPLTLLNKLDEVVREVFGVDFESKQGLFENGPITHFWGTPLLTVAGVAVQITHDFNWMEALNVPLNQLSLLQDDHHPLLHSFRLLLEEYGNHQSRLATTIFKSMTTILELSKEQRKSYMSTSTGFLRLYRYPHSAKANDVTWGMGAHTDSSVITILNQDQVGGLQISKDKQWLDVKPIPNTLVVHLGDMMQAMSNDKYKSVVHRVKVNLHHERISMGYFVFPKDEYAIQSSNYKPFSYADFRAQVQQDIKSIGFKVGLKRFRLMDETVQDSFIM